MAKKHEEEAHENHERWLLSYADFITLLMIFFIVMYSMGNTDAEKYKRIAASLSAAMGGGVASSSSGIPGDTDAVIPLEPITPGTDEITPTKPNDETSKEGEGTGNSELERIKVEIDEYLKENNLEAEVTTYIKEKGLVITLKDKILFDSGKADIKSSFALNLQRIGDILKETGSYIRIEGNTDTVPVHSPQFESNWELSTARATNVVKLLIDKCRLSPDKLSAVGYGEYRPITDNSTEAGRALNRRVDIVVIDSKFETTEINK